MDAIALRPYQLEAIEAIEDRFARGDRATLLIMPTGTGKTITFGSLARRWGERHRQKVLVLAHRGELIQQAADALSELGLSVGIEQAGSHARALGDPDVVIATVQTMRGRRLESWPSDAFGLIITDEAHHATADSYSRVYAHFGRARHLGVTATADRADGTCLGEVYDSVAYEYTLIDAMTAPPPGPYLSRLCVAQCEIGVDLREIRTVDGDLSASDLAAAIKPAVTRIASAVKRETPGRQTLVFTPDVGSAQAIATALDSIGESAQWVSGDDPDRAAKIGEYKRGSIRVLCNCALLTEGFDAPSTSAVVLARPTKSRSLYAQMVGRGTRLAPGKDDCLIVDFSWMAGKHQLVKPIELFASRLTQDAETEDAVRAEAARLVSDGTASDLLEAVAKAKEVVEAKRRRVLELAVQEWRGQYRRVTYDPLAAARATGIPQPGPSGYGAPATEKQIKALVNFGMKREDAERYSKTRAGAALKVLIARANRDLATQKQLNLLISRGVDPSIAAKMSVAEASRAIDAILRQRA